MTAATEKIIEKIDEIIRDPSHSSSRAKAEAVYRCAHEWQPIETAPIDGTEVDLFVPYLEGRVPDCVFTNGVWAYFTEYGDWEYSPHYEPIDEDWKPTHWTPKPPTPKQEIE